jgi:hypothetical protein
MGRKRSWHNLRYYPCICLERLRKGWSTSRTPQLSVAVCDVQFALQVHLSIKVTEIPKLMKILHPQCRYDIPLNQGSPSMARGPNAAWNIFYLLN